VGGGSGFKKGEPYYHAHKPVFPAQGKIIKSLSPLSPTNQLLPLLSLITAQLKTHMQSHPYTRQEIGKALPEGW